MNTEIKNDRRARKTKKALREGLAELLTEKSIQKITVRELTEKADIHRSTFYTNYIDIYDLYNQIEDSVIQEISDIFSENQKVDSKTFFRILFKYILENRQVCRMVLSKNVNPTFYSRLIDLFKETYLNCWRSELGIKSTVKELEYYSDFYLSGSMAVAGKWANSNSEYSSEQLIKIFSDINDNFSKIIKSKFKPLITRINTNSCKITYS